MSHEDRRLAAIMFTDIVGYSALSQRSESLALSILGDHRELLEPLFQDHNGVIVKSTGDGYLAEFASAIQAVQCAVAMQTAVHDRNNSSDPERVFQIRIGLHVGDIVHQDGDVLGDGVNIASRIEPLAEPGGICISEQVYDHVHNKVELHLVNLGPQELKNITLPLEIYRVFLPWEDVSSFTPRLIKSRCPSSRTFATKVAVLALPIVAILAAIGGYYFAPKGIVPDSTDDGLRTVAVLPFKDLSVGMDAGYFSQGLTEELINALSKLKGIRVPARTSSFTYRDSIKDLGEIADELEVEAVLTGSVRTDGKHFRISARLNDIKKDEVLWSKNFDHEMDSIFAVQDEITKKIVQTLKITLDVDDRNPIVVASTGDMEAYQCYLKGRDAWNDRTEEGFEKALMCFQNAVDHDPHYAQAYAGLADTFYLMERYGHIPTEEGRAKSKQNALKALELNPDLAAAHTSLATIFEFEWDWEAAEDEFKKAIELEPNSVIARQWYASLLSKMGRYDEALAQIETALPLDPKSGPLNRSYGAILAANESEDEAIRQLRSTLESHSDQPNIRPLLAVLLAKTGESEKARALLREERDQFQVSPELETNQAYVDLQAGDPQVLEQTLDQYLNSSDLPAHSFGIGMLYAFKGDLDESFTWLEKAVDVKDFNVTHLGTLIELEPLRKDPRYIALLEQMGLRSAMPTTKT